MAEPFNSIPAHLRDSTVGACSDRGGWTADHAAWLRSGNNSALVRAFMDAKMSNETEHRRAAEEAGQIVILNSGYNGGAAEMQRCKGPYSVYPTGWVPRTALERRDALKPFFPGVDFGRVEELAQDFYVDAPATDAPKNGGKLLLPEHADAGLLVWPKLEAAVRCIKKTKKGWGVDQIVAEYILAVFRDINPTFKDYTNGNVGPNYQRLHARAAKILRILDEQTPGDVLVQPFNAGALFAGYNVQSSRGHIGALKTHLPATDFMGFCFAITDPDAFTNKSLALDLPGTERAPRTDDVFDSAPNLCVCDGRFEHASHSVHYIGREYGSASVVLRMAVSAE